MAESPRYSLWFTPYGESGTRLHDLVEKLAKQYAAPAFEPHITLVAEIHDSLTVVQQKVTALAAEIEPFEASVTDYGFRDEEFRSLYLLARSAAFPAVYDQATASFPQVADEHFRSMPHLSVLYGHYSEEVKRKIIANNPLPELSFQVQSIDICASDGPASDWQIVDRIPLAG